VDATVDLTHFDLGRFAERLLLFETYVLKSARLVEVPTLIQVFGTKEFTELLESGALVIHPLCQCRLRQLPLEI
jgi:hypothetical protein